MALHTQRVQTVLTDEQFRQLSQIAAETEKPISALVREAVEAVYFTPRQEQIKREALRELFSLEAPVADWEQMEEEIIRGATA